jgi:hypothetical protein
MVALASAGRWNHYDVILGVFLLCVGDLNLMSYKSTSIYSVLHIHAYTREGACYCASPTLTWNPSLSRAGERAMLLICSHRLSTSLSLSLSFSLSLSVKDEGCGRRHVHVLLGRAGLAGNAPLGWVLTVRSYRAMQHHTSHAACLTENEGTDSSEPATSSRITDQTAAFKSSR